MRIEFSTPAQTVVYPPGTTYGPRLLRDYEFVWIIDGDVEWTCNGSTFEAGPGSVILCRPGMHDRFRWDRHKPTCHGFFHFLIRGSRAQIPPDNEWPTVVQMPDGDVVRPLFRHLMSLTQTRPEGWPSIASDSAALLLKTFVTLTFHARGENHSGFPDVVEKVLSFVQNRWSDGPVTPLALSELAEAAAVSPGHLCRVFTRSVGFGPIEALRLMRLDRAATLLAHSNLQVQEVATLTGFESAFHFSRRFRETYGIAPRVFRAKFEAGETVPILHIGRIRPLAGRIWQGT